MNPAARKLVLRLMLAAGAAAFAPARAAERGTLQTDIEYGRAGGVSLMLDVHVPDGEGPFPVAIVVHGGGWGSGDKRGADQPGSGADITPLFAPLSSARFTWFSINYRLAPAHLWPASLEDTLAAIRWVKAHASRFKGDPGRMALIGHSAGGHLAFMAAMDGGADTRVQAIVGCAPATDFEQDLAARGGLSVALQNLFGRPREVTPAALALLRETSPINHVRPGLPPVLLLHGDADRSVPLLQSLNFHARLQASRVPCDLITLPGAPHRLTEWRVHDPDWAGKMVDWLQRTLAARSSEAPPGAGGRGPPNPSPGDTAPDQGSDPTPGSPAAPQSS